ncbi:hypothetical protein NXX09_08570 [Bacteroides uniformis]|nr:hypothetical protein [Bacteroides uniformis]
MKYIIRTLLLACCCMQAQAQAPWKPDTEPGETITAKQSCAPHNES